MKKIELIAHRGLHDMKLWAPENSCEAFRRAVYYGFSVELDVQLTKDGRIVVFHDYNIKKLTDVDGHIRDYTLEELKQFRLMGTSERIPALSEVLNIVRGRVPVYIEIKTYSSSFGKIEKLLLREMKGYKGKWIVISFSFPRLLYMRNKDKEITRGQLIPCRDSGESVFVSLLSGKAFISAYTGLFSKPVYLMFEKSCADLDTALFSSSLSEKLIIWTIKDRKELENYSKFADGVIFEGFMP